MAISFTTSGGEEVAKALDEKIKSIKEKEKDAMEQVCLFLEAEAKTNCPSGTGVLRESITYDVEEEGNAVKGYIGSNLMYAPYVHQGTGIYAANGDGRQEVPWTYYDDKTGEYVTTYGIHPTPFLQDAVDTNRDKITKYFEGIAE